LSSLGGGCIEEGTIYRAPTGGGVKSGLNGARYLVGNAELGETYAYKGICYARRMPWNPPEKGDRR